MSAIRGSLPGLLWNFWIYIILDLDFNFSLSLLFMPIISKFFMC